MIWAAIIIIYLTFIRMVVAVANLLVSPLSRTPGATNGSLVSVLVPARNEEAALGNLLDSLLAQDYKSFEVIVYNDSSTDGTGDVLKRYTGEGSRVRHIDGGELPEGWLGKNHACHRLAESAAGEYLMFIDADVTASPQLISAAVARMEDQRLSLLSIFPFQEMKTRGERVVVPVMNWILLSLLPMALVRRCRWSSFAAANGQFMMFRATVYKRHRFHEIVRMRLTEDIVIARIMKRMRLRVETLVSRGGDISCRMYGGYEEAVRGFSKNVITMFGDSYLFIGFFVLVAAAGWLPVYLGLGWYGVLGYCLMTVVINISVALAGGQNIAGALMLFPERMAAFFTIVYGAVLARYRKSYNWKGREISEIK